MIKNTSKYNNVLLEDTLKKAIKRQTISDVPLSIFLSGGLDSSSILHFLDYFDKKILIHLQSKTILTVIFQKEIFMTYLMPGKLLKYTTLNYMK